MSAPVTSTLGLLVILVLWMLGAHNRVTGLKRQVLTAWQGVEQAFGQRAEALQSLLRTVSPVLSGGEQAAIEAVESALAQVVEQSAQVKRKPLDRDAVAELSKADAVLGATLPRLLALVEYHPELAHEATVREALARLGELKLQLAYARRAFNEAGTAYNAAIHQLPTRLLAPVLRFGEAGQL